MQDDSTNKKNQAEEDIPTQNNISLSPLLKWSGIILLICPVLLMLVGLMAPLQFLFYLISGWIWFLSKSFNHISPDYSTVQIGSIALILFTVGLKYLASSLLQKLEIDLTLNWSLRSSLLVTLLICVGFIAGIAMIGVTHQVTWLATSGDHLTWNYGRNYRWEDRYQRNSKFNLMQISLALHNYHDDKKTFPLGQTSNSQGRALHSWLTILLPYVEQGELYDQIDFDVPWNNEVNREAIEQPVDAYYSPAIKNNRLDPVTELPIAHYAGNVRVIQRNSKISFQDITDGISNTILSGEVNNQFQPWGKPNHLRDPAIGINKYPFGFGRPFRSEENTGFTLFAMVDGSVRNIAEDIDPQVLKALSTPNGGDVIDTDF